MNRAGVRRADANASCLASVVESAIATIVAANGWSVGPQIGRNRNVAELALIFGVYGAVWIAHVVNAAAARAISRCGIRVNATNPGRVLRAAKRSLASEHLAHP